MKEENETQEVEEKPKKGKIFGDPYCEIDI